MNLSSSTIHYSNLPPKLVLKCTLFFLIIFSVKARAQEALNPSHLPDIRYHLTARPWEPLNTSRTKYLDKVEEIVRQIVKYQNASGAIIDPYSKKEIQYSTPYFANAVGTLISSGRAADLLGKGIAAMNSATQDIAFGSDSIPDDHGEFFIGPLTSAIPLYAPHVSDDLVSLWQKRLQKPIEDILRNRDHNWRTYAMKGEWLRAKSGLVDKASAVGWIEDSWKTSQKARFQSNSLNFYHDETSDPDTWPYESAARGNLLSMVAADYTGASAAEISALLQSASQNSLLLQDPTGQGIAGGRTGNHTWNDIVLANSYETMAEIMNEKGNSRLAGQYRRAAALGFKSALRFQRNDGTFSVTKNHFDPKLEIRYAGYSHLTNYNGYMMYHLSENFIRHTSAITEQPAPNEIGGYTIVTDKSLATAGANAGGMALQATLRGSNELSYDLYWSTLGVVRFSRTGWDSRLGPSDGVRETASKLGVSFAPEFMENGNWIRLASIPYRYEAVFSTQFTHPLLVKCRLVYKPKTGETGPTFTNDFVVTPDGILSTIKSTAGNFGVTWPVLTYDGTTTLKNTFTSTIASTSFAATGDQQNFIALNSAPTINSSIPALRSSYGDLKPVRMVSNTEDNVTFIYPRNASDPPAESVRKSFNRSGNNFSSLLGKVVGNTYAGRSSAGGISKSLDIDDDNLADITFSDTCGFILQLSKGKIFKVETDKIVTATIYGKSYTLNSYSPVSVDTLADPVPPDNLIKLIVKTVSASGDEGNENVAANTIDSNFTTRWSVYGDNEWIKYDLGKEDSVQKVNIAWHRGDERIASFDIYTSVNNVEWTKVFTGKSSGITNSFEAYKINGINARYIKIVVHGTTLHLWNAINEVELRGNELDETPPASLSKLPVYVIIASDDEDKVNNLTDGNVTTRWAAEGDGNFIAADLGGLNNLRQIKIAWYKGHERVTSFDIETSIDGLTWTKIYSGKSSGKTLDYEIYTFTSGNSRYVKVIGHGTNMDAWNAINEIEFYGSVIEKPKPYTILPVKLATASSDEGNGNVAANTVDKNLSTRWSAYGDDQWVMLNMETIDTIKSLNIAWYRGYKKTITFDVQTSTDMADWKTIFSGKSSGISIFFEKVPIPQTLAAYVRIVTHSSNLYLWNAINEIEVLGTIAKSQLNKLIVSSATASADDGNKVQNSIDSNLNTRWSALGEERSLHLTLKNSDTIKQVKISWFKGDLRTADYNIEVSADNINWKTIYTGTTSGTTTAFQLADVPDTAVKYLRIVCLGNSINEWNSITEIEVWGSMAPAGSELPGSALATNRLITTVAETGQFALGNTDQLSANVHLPGNASKNNTPSTAIVLWPNPNKGVFAVKSDIMVWQGGRLQVFNSSGKVILTRKINQGITSLDISKKPKGIYFIHLKKGVKEFQSKIITQ